MWKMILGQSVYKLAIVFMLYFAGDQILNDHLVSDDPALRAKQLSTVVFNTFVWMQIFNELNNRRLDNRFNIFEGMFRNYWFLGINTLIVAGQVMIIFVGGQAFGVTRINGTLWAVCIICGFGCLPWAVVLRLIPDRHFGVVFNATVSACSFILRPFLMIWKIIVRGVKAIFQPVTRFSRRVFSRRRVKTSESAEESSGTPEGLDAPVVDEENPAERKVVREESPERPSAPPAISVPPITVTASP